MAGKKEIEDITEQVMSMENLVQTYQEVSSMQMRNIRSNVLSSRGFTDDLEAIYQQLQYSYHKQIVDLLKEKEKKKKKEPENKKKVLAVFISANTGLLGDSMIATYDLFSKYITTHQCDILVVGKLGRRLMQDRLPQVGFQFYNGPETDEMSMDIIMLQTFINTMLHLNYENIYMFYSKFRTFASQTPFMLDVYGEQSQREQQNVTRAHYLFEPNIEKILEFFQKEIFAMIIEQAFSESSLSKYAARLITLNTATDNIEIYLKQLQLQRRIIIHRIVNQKQQQTFSSMTLWNIR